MSTVLADALRVQFEPIEPMDFYRDIFPEGELAAWEDNPSEDSPSSEHGYQYVGIALEITGQKKKNGKELVKRHTICDELDTIDLLLHSNHFVALAPISYIGKTRHSRNARFMYALCIEIDGLQVKKGKQVGLNNLIALWSVDEPYIPQPTYIVASGSGVHLYYVFDKPLALFPNVVEELKNMRKELTKKLWNRKVTVFYEETQIQYESLFQPFRLVGGKTKKGDRTEAFRTGDKVSIAYLNQFVKPHNQVSEAYRSKFSISDAKAKFPEWYERRIVRGEPKKKWNITEKVNGNNPYALYDWYLNRFRNEGKVGKRFYCLLMLVIVAIKCDVPQKRLEDDCFELFEKFKKMPAEEDNPFTEKDLLDALQAFEDKELFTYPVNSIANRAGIEIVKNKRNGRKQNIHMRIMSSTRDILYPEGSWRNKDGRPSVEHIVREWQQQNPGKRKVDCIRETKLDKKTVYKWWQDEK